MNKETIRKKALQFYCKEVIEGLPLKWTDDAIDLMLAENQDPPTEKVKALIDFVIEETKLQLTEER